MKKWLSFLCAFALLASCVNIPTAHAADVLTEEKIELPGKALYRYTFDQDEQVFKCRGEVTEDAAYQVLTDGDYTTDAAIGQQTFVVLDLGKEYPISTIKAYQTGDNASNFVSVVEGFSGITDTFTRNDCGDLLRTNITSTSENGAKCYTKTELSSRSHRIGTYRYLLFYNWSTRLTLSEIELYQDTTTKTDALSVSNFYGDNMVLQREKNHVIKGYSATGETVQVTMTEDASSSNTETVTVNPDESGNWKAELPPMKAGMSPYTITISDGTSAPEIKLSNVLVGDVFLASGQSNMAYDAPKAADQRETQYNNIDGPNGAIYYKKGMFELQSAIASDKIRMFRMREDGQAESGVVTEDVPVWIDWCPSDGERLETSSLGVTTARRHKNILALSSLAAFFADRLAEETEIPVGIIQASRGGSAINIWSKKGRLYNNHIAPLDGLNIAGVLWYQGCADSNATGFKTYYNDFKNLIQDYRGIFHDKTLPFLYVQLAPYKNSEPEYQSPGSQRFQVMREIQRKMLNDSDVNTNLYMAVSMDTTQDSHHTADGTVVNQSLIHPLGKDILGKRMANAYLGMIKKDRVISGPLVDQATAEGSTVTVTFQEGTADGLKVLNPDYSYRCDGSGRSSATELQEFTLAGADGVYYDAKAEIAGNTVKVTSDQVPDPCYVSYAYSELPANPNLANGADLPASPFHIGLNGADAPEAPAEQEPKPEPDPEPEPGTDNSVVLDDSIRRGVEHAIAEIDMPEDPSMQFEDGDKVAIIGDSITNQDFYSSYLMQLYAAKKPDARIKFYNMGIGGDTAELGLGMLDKEFAMLKKYDNVVPNKVVIMFGMNDVGLLIAAGHSDEENIALFKENMTKLVAAVKAKGVKEITLMSSSPYDDTMVSDVAITTNKVGARNRMIQYAEWLETFTKENQCHYIDLTRTMYRLLDAYQEDDPTRTFINPDDRIHPRELGGFVMMYLIAKAHGLDGANLETELTVSDDKVAVNSGTVQDAVGTPESLSFTYTPSGTTILPITGYFEANRIVPLTRDYNQDVIRINGLKEGTYDLVLDGTAFGPYTESDLAQGINTAVIPNTPSGKRAAQLYGDMFDAHRVCINYIRNIRTAEKKALQYGIDPMDDDKVREYVENADDEELQPQFKNAYLNYKETEQDLFDQYSALIDKMYEDVNRTVTPVPVTVRPHEPNNEMDLWSENFNNGISQWKLMRIGASDADYGQTVCEYKVGSDLPNGSGAGSARIDIGINNARDYYSIKNHIPVKGGHKFYVSAAVKTENVRTTDLVNMSVLFYDKDDSQTVGSEIRINDDTKGTHEWQTIGSSVTVPEDAYYMRIDLSGRCQTEGAEEKQGTVWYDDVRVTSELQNADFEDAANGVASAWTTTDIPSAIPENFDSDLMNFRSNWTVGTNSMPAVTASYDQEDYVTGGRSLKFVSTASGESADRSYFHTGSQYVKLKPDTFYKITMKAKTQNYQLLDQFSQGKPAGLTYQALLYQESNGAADTAHPYSLSASYLNVPGQTDSASDSDWTDYSMVLKTPAAEDGQTWQYLRSNVMMRYASGTAWVDSIRIEECDEQGTVATQDNIDTEDKAEGNQALVIRGGEEGVTYSSEPFAVTACQPYLFRAYAKKEEAAAGTIKLETYTYSGKASKSFELSVADTEFTKYEQTLEMPEDAAYAVIRLYGENGDVRFDDIGLSRMTGERDRAYGAETEGMLGDVNDDGYVTSKDALMALKAANGSIVLTDLQKQRADMNKDQNVTLSDALEILKAALEN